jgi:hypothetical protein
MQALLSSQQSCCVSAAAAAATATPLLLPCCTVKTQQQQQQQRQQKVSHVLQSQACSNASAAANGLQYISECLLLHKVTQCIVLCCGWLFSAELVAALLVFGCSLRHCCLCAPCNPSSFSLAAAGAGSQGVEGAASTPGARECTVGSVVHLQLVLFQRAD